MQWPGPEIQKFRESKRFGQGEAAAEKQAARRIVFFPVQRNVERIRCEAELHPPDAGKRQQGGHFTPASRLRAEESGKVEGAMTPSVIGAKLIAKIADASALGALVKLTITDSAAPDAPFTFELTDKMADAIAPGDALVKAYEHFKSEIDAELASEDGMHREIYVRFVNGKTDRDSEYYWYVSFAADRGNDMSVLLDPSSGEVVTSRIRP